RHGALVAGRRIEVVADDEHRRRRTRRPWAEVTVLPGGTRPRPARTPGPVPDPAEIAVPAFVAICGRLPGLEGPRVDGVRAGDSGRALHVVRVFLLRHAG